MSSKTSLMFAALTCAALATTLVAQDTASIPAARGVYYRADSGWVGLTGTVLTPMITNTTADFFNVGPKMAIAEVPGMHAMIQTNNAKPTLYVRGFPVNYGIYLVRQEQRAEYREIRMPVSRNFNEYTHFRSKDLREIEMRPVGNGLVAVTPVKDLAAGEYALVALVDHDRFIKIGYDFGIAGGARK